MAAVQPAGSWDGNTAGERRWTFLGRNGREGDTEDGLKFLIEFSQELRL